MDPRVNQRMANFWDIKLRLQTIVILQVLLLQQVNLFGSLESVLQPLPQMFSVQPTQ
jgi:hypothetical protein